MLKYTLRISGLLALQLLFPFLSSTGQTSTINYKGNILEVRDMADTTEILDPVTMEAETIINNPDPIPLKLNNMNIYAVNEVENPPSITGDAVRRETIQRIRSHITKDGEYRLLLDNVVISEKGKIVYYNFNGVEKKTTTKVAPAIAGSTKSADYAIGRVEWKETDKVLSNAVSAQIEKIIDNTPAYKPAMVYKQPVPCLLDPKDLQRPFFVKNGAIQY
ncbi:MAG TPA: hypothetical protein VEB40_11520 [Flavipsychrobacter sp.]|nr:hypothetical protein [Flavipsychrobacter sp.]